MKKLTFAIMGMGNRGTAYAGKQLKYPEEMEVVAMADTRRIRLDAANKYLHLPEDRLFDSADALLDKVQKYCIRENEMGLHLPDYSKALPVFILSNELKDGKIQHFYRVNYVSPTEGSQQRAAEYIAQGKLYAVL